MVLSYSVNAGDPIMSGAGVPLAVVSPVSHSSSCAGSRRQRKNRKQSQHKKSRKEHKSSRQSRQSRQNRKNKTQRRHYNRTLKHRRREQVGGGPTYMNNLEATQQYGDAVGPQAAMMAEAAPAITN